jgi:serine/threonine-protein kinase Chk1
MGPEVTCGNYQGPPADIFSMGVMLFLMSKAEFAFGVANDQYYTALHQNPHDSMKDRDIDIDADLLDLVVGMTKKDPSHRYTLQEIKNHKWFQGEMASPEEMKSHFLKVMGRASEEAKENYTANQAAKQNIT